MYKVITPFTCTINRKVYQVGDTYECPIPRRIEALLGNNPNNRVYLEEVKEESEAPKKTTRKRRKKVTND